MVRLPVCPNPAESLQADGKGSVPSRVLGIRWSKKARPRAKNAPRAAPRRLLDPLTPPKDPYRKGAMERYAYSPGERRRAETSPGRSGELLPEATFSFSKNKKIYLNSRRKRGVDTTEVDQFMVEFKKQKEKEN